MNRLTRRARPPEPPAPEPAPDWGARIRDLAGIIAPTTAITALLLYFGYIGTRARFAYFGVYLDLAELSNQDLMLYGLEVLYVPAALVLVAILLAAGCHALVSWLVAEPAKRTAALAAAGFALVAGVLLVARGTVGLLVVQVSRFEFPGTSALCLALGPVLIAYGTWAGGRVLSTHGETRFRRWYTTPQVTRIRRVVTVTAAGLVFVGLFWAANTFAWSFGQGRAADDATILAGEAEVVLDTKQALADLPEGVTSAELPDTPEDGFRYRYRGLRLLVAAEDRLFLIPADWARGGRTLVVPYDDQVRLQLIPSG
ncbi:hypothetical protein AB0M02_28885 [Actinoplanes sp. NPDC051861]|uniref:hypothetical protein n=1 Tax=Actinoplanes sp. NPDC051861 TaxID=3155170 RepID=UPI003413A895